MKPELNAKLPSSPITGVPVEDAKGGMLLGLTKREMFAMHAMANLKTGHYASFSDMASDAVSMADALLEELAKSRGEV